MKQDRPPRSTDWLRKLLTSRGPSRRLHPHLSLSCQIVLETEVSNLASLKLYERLGFVRVKRLEHYYMNRNDAFRLVLVPDTVSEPDEPGGGGRRIDDSDEMRDSTTSSRAATTTLAPKDYQLRAPRSDGSDTEQPPARIGFHNRPSFPPSLPGAWSLAPMFTLPSIPVLPVHVMRLRQMHEDTSTAKSIYV